MTAGLSPLSVDSAPHTAFVHVGCYISTGTFKNVLIDSFKIAITHYILVEITDVNRNNYILPKIKKKKIMRSVAVSSYIFRNFFMFGLLCHDVLFFIKAHKENLASRRHVSGGGRSIQQPAWIAVEVLVGDKTKLLTQSCPHCELHCGI